MGNWVHPYKPRDEIWVKDWGKNEELLQPVWTGPHVVVLATPAAVTVTGVITWIYHTRVKKAVASCNEDTWKTVRDPKSPLKVWFLKQRSSPTKDAEPCSSHSGSRLVHAWQQPEDSSALLQPRSGSWLVNAQQKLEDLAIKISMGFHCQPWTLSLIGITAVLFATGLASVTPQDWDLGQKLWLAVCYLTVVGSLILLDVSYDQFSLLTKLLHSIPDAQLL